MQRIHVDVVNRTTLLSHAEIRRCVAALRVQVRRDFAPVWGRTADLHYASAPSKAHPGAWQMVLLDNRDADDGYHQLTREGLPLGKVFVREARKCPSGWTSTASHELLELLANPDTTLGVLVEDLGRGARVYPCEVCDPCQDDRFTYLIDGVAVSDFVHPAWFEPWRKPRSAQFDQAGRLRRPFEVPEACYAQYFDVHAKSWRDDWGGKTTPHLAVYGASSDRGGSRRPLRGIPRHKWLKSRV
jgi:hypothetical protein